MSELVPASFGGQLSTKFATTPVADDLSSGIQSSFGLVGYKGKVWSIRYRGEDRQLMRDDGDGPRGSIEVVILKASSQISKIWYEQGYVEGSNAAPDCFSNNGIAPEPTSVKKQCDSCALCPHNQWGSRITPAGKSGKACADSKRLAVAPLNDLLNEAYGGPMLLRVPAASLQDVAMFGQKMQQMGYPYFSIGTKIAFDPAESYPKFVFSALRPLSDAEADIVLSIRDGHTVQRILSENEFGTPAAAPAAPAEDKPLFEQAPDVGPRVDTTVTQAQQASVGDQARAAAAAQAEAVKAAQAAAKAKKAAEAKAALAAAEAEAAAAEAAAQAATQAAAVTSEVTHVNGQEATIETESDEDREMREMEAALAAARARKAAAAAQAAQAQAQPITAPVVEAAATVVEADPQNVASSFEADLDSMLADLLPN